MMYVLNAESLYVSCAEGFYGTGSLQIFSVFQITSLFLLKSQRRKVDYRVRCLSHFAHFSVLSSLVNAVEMF